MTDDILDLPVVELARKLAAREFTAVELTEGYLDRIARIEPGLNCYITVTAERARADAARADSERAAGRTGALLGIPYAMKDLIDTAGIPTTWGTPSQLGRVPEADAPVAAKLAAAGGVLLGKLSMVELANGLGNVTPDANHKGCCRNPWDRKRWAGGSSSGSGSATAAGLCGFSLGSETYGSIDCPSSYCGVTGLRPTYDVVSRAGALTLSWTFDKIGPMCRDARDLRPLLAAMVTAPMPALDGPPADRALRVGYVDGPDPRTDPAYVPTWDRAKEALGQAFTVFESVTLPAVAVEAAANALVITDIIAALEDFGREHGSHLYDRKPFDQTMRGYRAIGLRADDYVKAMRVRTQAQRAYDELFAKYDVLVCAGRPELAWPAEKSFATWVDIKGPHATLQAAGNLIGAPAITVPSGFTDSGLPLSIHAIAAPYEDHNVIALGEAFQAQTGHHARRPPPA